MDAAVTSTPTFQQPLTYPLPQGDELTYYDPLVSESASVREANNSQARAETEYEDSRFVEGCRERLGDLLADTDL